MYTEILWVIPDQIDAALGGEIVVLIAPQNINTSSHSNLSFGRREVSVVIWYAAPEHSEVCLLHLSSLLCWEWFFFSAWVSVGYLVLDGRIVNMILQKARIWWGYFIVSCIRSPLCSLQRSFLDHWLSPLFAKGSVRLTCVSWDSRNNLVYLPRVFLMV